MTLYEMLINLVNSEYQSGIFGISTKTALIEMLQLVMSGTVTDYQKAKDILAQNWPGFWH